LQQAALNANSVGRTSVGDIESEYKHGSRLSHDDAERTKIYKKIYDIIYHYNTQMEPTSPILLNVRMKKNIFTSRRFFSDQEDDDDVLIDSNRRVNYTRRFVVVCTQPVDVDVVISLMKRRLIYDG